MNKTQLELFKMASEEFKKLVAHHVDRLEIQGAPTQTIPTLHHDGNPQQTQILQPQLFQNTMIQPHLFGFNNMGGSDEYQTSRFF